MNGIFGLLLLVIAYVDAHVDAQHHDCPMVKCNATPYPDQCPEGTRLRMQVKRGCRYCKCCLNQFNQCVTPNPQICPKPPCPFIDEGQCPQGTRLKSPINPNSGCEGCPCCMSKKTGKCVDIKPCTKACIKPPDPLDCARGSILGKRECCECCLSRRTQFCVTPPDCAAVSCLTAPDPSECPAGSYLETKGCCPCCYNPTIGDCVRPVACTNKIHCGPTPEPLDCGWGSVLEKKGCCPCCVNTKMHACVKPPDCSTLKCVEPPDPDRCPPKSSVQTKGCCQCCVSEETGDCVEVTPGICPLYLCVSLPMGKTCPPDSTLTPQKNLNTGCPACPCCISDTHGDCVDPIDEPVHIALEP